MRPIHLLLVVGAGLFCFAILMPAVLPETAWVRFLFAPVCHQLPDRSFWLNGRPLAVCVRCSGFYAGFLTGLLFYAIRAIPMHGGALRVLLGVTLCDAINAFLGVVPESVLFRFGSALALSIALTPFIIRGLEEGLAKVRPASMRPQLSSFTRKEI